MKKLLLILILGVSIFTSVFAQQNSEFKRVFAEEREDPSVLPKNIQIYPNPASDFVKIDLQSIHTRSYQFRLYNVIGNDFPLSINEEDHGVIKFDVKDLPAGYYWILILDKESGSRKAFKFLKK